MATPAELVRDNAEQLAGYHPELRRLITQTSTPGATAAITPRHPDPPFPGNAPAFAALMVITEAVPRLEARLRLEIAGHPGRRRGGSAQNFLDALKEIVRQSGGLDEDWEAWTGRTLERLLNVVRAIPDIDEAQQWRHLRGRACPYCHRLATLKVLLDARKRPTDRVECRGGARATGERCLDRDGARPVATVGTDKRGVFGLLWNDGLFEPAPDLDAT